MNQPVSKPFHVQRIDHVEVLVRDVKRSVEWYRKVLGLRVAEMWEGEPVLLGAGENYLALFTAKHAGPNNSDDNRQPPIRWRRVAWRTDQVGFEAAQEHLRDCGVAFEGPVDHQVAFSLYFEDPDGNPLEITYDV